MPAFSKGLTGAFREKHLLKSSFDDSDMASSAPLACICRLMTLSMVFGQALPVNGLSSSCYVKDNCMGGASFAAFSLHQDLRGKNISWYWVSDSSFDSCFWSLSHSADGFLDLGVLAVPQLASFEFGGVRPFALLV